MSLVARLIWQRKKISRADIARELGLYRSTVTNITSFLIDAGVVKEGNLQAAKTQGGRKGMELSINPSFGCVIGFDIQPSHYRIVILAADGTELWRENGSFGVMPLLEMLDKAINRALAAHQDIGIPILALSFAIPGIVDSSFGTVINSFPFGVSNLDVRDYLTRRYSFPVYVENDANTAAWLDILKSGAWGNAVTVVADFHEECKTDPNIIGIGCGIGLIMYGRVYRGTHNAAGEFKSVSWRYGLNNQSGLPSGILKQTMDDREALAQWMVDTFRSFIPLMSVMDAQKMILHGTPFSDKEWVLKTLRERVPEFIGLMDEYGCQMIFDAQDECVSASGAAMMFLHNLFSVPDLGDQSRNLTWNETIALLRQQRSLIKTMTINGGN